VISKSTLEGGGGGKAKGAAKGKAPVATEEDAEKKLVTVEDGTVALILDHVNKEIAARQDALYMKRKMHIAQVQEANGAKGGKNTGRGKPPAKAPPKKAPAKGAPAAAGAAAAPKEDDLDDEAKAKIQLPTCMFLK
jgi:hypothetical protein